MWPGTRTSVCFRISPSPTQHANATERTKTLSENCQVEQDVTAGKLNKRQPVLGLLCPARTEAATLAQPRDRALHHPSPCRMRLLWGDLSFLQRFATRFGTLAPSGIDLDVSCVACGS